MTGNFDMDTQFIHNVVDPVNPQHAATKNYVGTTSVSKAGDNMNGDLTMGGNEIKGLSIAQPTTDGHAATKAYVDLMAQATTSNIETKVLLLDGTTQPTQDIDWNGKRTTGLADPTNAQDVATKNYVDT